MKFFNLLFLLIFISACAKKTNDVSPVDDTKNLNLVDVNCNNSNFRSSWIKDVNGESMLFGGEDNISDFNISNLSIDPCGFKYGLGREAFKALITPEFINFEKADKIYYDHSRFLVAISGDEVKAYSVDLLVRHEIINDRIGGHPIMAAYCVLADLGAVYSREYCGETLTFGLSGYTYSDAKVWEGVNAFVLWDRDTESLWWPLIDKAISGGMEGQILKKYDGQWLDTTWKTIKEKYKNAVVLKAGQTMDVPENWPQINPCK